jgi:hypothetical protein
VCADPAIASTTLSTGLSGTATSTYKTHGLFGAAINLDRLFLMAEPHHLGYVYAGNPDLPQRTLDFFEFE